MARRRIIIDTDPGQDDAVALLLAFASRQALDIRLVATVAGNAALDLVTANALRIRDLAGADDVPVASGMAGPMLLPLETAAYICGPDGLAGADLPPPRTAHRAGHAVEAIIAECRAAPPGGVTICALGPLSNIAMALRLAPDIAERIERFVVMGGAIGLGNVTPAAEFNFYVDPQAAAVVLGAGRPVTLFGLHATHQAIASAEDLGRIAALGTATGRAVHGMLTRPRPGGLGGDGGHPMHDPCVIAWALWPELFSGRDCHVTVELSESVRGRTTIDWNGRLKRPPNAFVIDRLERAELFDRLIAALGRLP
jgi:purine nucleosidase